MAFAQTNMKYEENSIFKILSLVFLDVQHMQVVIHFEY